MSDEKNSQQLENALIKAKQLLNTGKVAEAMSLLTDIINMNPGEPRAQKLFDYAKSLKNVAGESANIGSAESLFASGEYEKAMAVVQSVLQKDPSNEQIKALGAKIQEKLEALPFISQYENNGRKLFDEGDFSGAVSEWKKIKELDSNYIKVDKLIEEAEQKITEQAGSLPDSDIFSDGAAPELITENVGIIDPSDPFALDETSEPAPTAEVSSSDLDDFGGFNETPELSEADIPTAIQSQDTPEAGQQDDFAVGSEDQPELSGSDLSMDDDPAPEITDDFGLDDGAPDSFPDSGLQDDAGETSQIEQYFKEGMDLYERGQCQQAIDKWQLIFIYDENNENAKEYIKKAQFEIAQKQQTLSVDEVKSVLAAGDYGRAALLCEELLSEDHQNEDLISLKKRIADERESEFIKPTLFKAENMMNQGMYDDAVLEVEKILAFNPVHEEATALIRKIHETKAEEGNAEHNQAQAVSDDEEFRESLEESQHPAEEKKSSSKMIIIAALVIIILGAVAAYLFKDKLFGPDETIKTTQAQTEQDQAKKREAALNLKNAKQNIQEGNVIDALNLLRKIDTADAEFPEAISLIKKLEESMADTQEQEPEEAVLTPEELLDQKVNQASELVVKAKAVIDQGEYNAAKQYIEEALKLDPTNLEAMDMKDKVNKKLAMETDEQRRYKEAISYYNEGMFQDALRVFYRMKQDGKMVNECQKYIELSWFNWGVRELKNANCTEAINKFNEYLAEAKVQDEEANKHIKLAEMYKAKAKDESFKHYIEFIEFRQP